MHVIFDNPGSLQSTPKYFDQGTLADIDDLISSTYKEGFLAFVFLADRYKKHSSGLKTPSPFYIPVTL